MGTLGGKVAIVTGAGRGIGRAQALELARQGARVVVNDLPRGEPRPADVTVGEIIAAGGEAVSASHNVATLPGAAAIVQAAIDAFGRVDILVNTAGLGRVGAVQEMSEADWDAVIAVNLRGTFLMVRHAAAHFIAQRSGAIVNIASDAGLGDYYLSPYSAAKEGIVGFTRAMARELGRFGIRCNALRPRAFDTGMATEVGFERQIAFNRNFGRPMCGTHPIRHNILGKAAEVAAITAWLCSDAAAILNGRVIAAGGGEIGLWSEPQVERACFDPDGWTVEKLARVTDYLLTGVTNVHATLPQAALDMIDARIEAHRQRLATLTGKPARA